MISIYKLSDSISLLCIMTIATAILFQTALVVYSFAYRKYNSNKSFCIYTELVILLQFLLELFIFSDCRFHSERGFALSLSVMPVSLALLFGAIVTSVICLKKKKKLWFFTIPLCLFCIQPFMEELYREKFPIAVMLFITIFSIRSLSILLKYNEISRSCISPFTLKDAIDSFDFGLMLYKNEEPCKGEIYLCNNKMRNLMFTLTGNLLYNGEEFLNLLQNHQSLDTCTYEQESTLPTLILPDKHIWQFRTDLAGDNSECLLISASDITEYKKAVQELKKKDYELKERNLELKNMIDNIAYICKEEEIIRIKSRIHDVLGRTISILLRDLREHRIPDEKTLKDFAINLINQLEEKQDDSDYSLDILINDFNRLGVDIIVSGEEPEEELLKRIFYETAMEAVSNAVRHGYANKIFIKFIYKDKYSEMTVTDNGISTSKQVNEGGGFKEARRRAEECGGSFFYHTLPRFTIITRIPKGEKND